MSKTTPKKRQSTTKLLNRPRRQLRARITLDDVERFCELTGNHRLNIGEALAVLGIQRKTWEGWLADHESQFSSTLSRVRGSYIEGRLAVLHDAERGAGGHRPDWRAGAHLLAITDKLRYGNAPQPEERPASVPEVKISAWLTIAQQRLGEETPAPAAIEAQEIKALPAPQSPTGKPAGVPPMLPPDRLLDPE